jgi:hypothetical protein
MPRPTPCPADPLDTIGLRVARDLDLPPSCGRWLVETDEGLARLDRLIELRKLSLSDLRPKPSPHLRGILSAAHAWGGEEFCERELRDAASRRAALAAAIAPLIDGKKEPGNALGKFLISQAEIPVEGLRLVFSGAREGVNYFRIVKD